jgi:hypothetical protein
LAFLPFEKSESPNDVNVVELRRNTYSKESKAIPYGFDTAPIQVYYGKIGSELQKYGEFSGSDQYKWIHSKSHGMIISM